MSPPRPSSPGSHPRHRHPARRRRTRLPENRSKAARLVHRYYDPATGSFLSVDPDAEQTQQPYVYADDDSVNATDPSGLCWSLAPGIYGPCLPPPPGVPYSGSFTPNEIAEYPEVVRGMNPGDLIRNLDWTAYDLPEGWKIEAGQGESVGPGWKLFNEGDGGYQFRWSPGSARATHPTGPYWRISSGRFGKSTPIEAGSWTDGPVTFTGSTTEPVDVTWTAGGETRSTGSGTGISTDITGTGETGVPGTGDEGGDGGDLGDAGFDLIAYHRLNPIHCGSYAL